MKILLKN